VRSYMLSKRERCDKPNCPSPQCQQGPRANGISPDYSQKGWAFDLWPTRSASQDLMSCEQKKPATSESGDSKCGLIWDVKCYWGTELSGAGTTVSTAFWMAV
jgi:hypothetical protein